MTEEQLKNYLFTLDICEKNLPSGTHGDHFTRLMEIKRILELYYKKGEK